jgi:hypothetical protein
MNIDFKDLEILQKFFYNRANYDLFMEAMMAQYNDKNYIEPLWSQFRDNAIGFLVARNEVQVFEFFKNKIIETGYKG